MKKVLNIFLLVLFAILFILSYFLLKIFTLAVDLFQWLEGVLRKAVYKKRGNIKGSDE